MKDPFQTSRPPVVVSKTKLHRSSRFDFASSVRTQCGYVEHLETNHLGPGTYELPSFGNPHPVHSMRSAKIPKSNVPAQDTLFPHPQAPPVGTYNITRLMSPSPKDRYSSISSSFHSSGRTSELMNDAKHYRTMKNEVFESNMGPGAHDFKDSWTTTHRNNFTFRSSRSHLTPSDMETSISRPSTSHGSASRSCSPTLISSHGLMPPLHRPKTSGGLPSNSQYATIREAKKAFLALENEKLMDIISVKDLPGYR